MITAEEAKELTAEARQEMYRVAIRDTNARIRHATQWGRHQCHIEVRAFVAASVADHLRERGFRVHVSPLSDNYRLNIWW